MWERKKDPMPAQSTVTDENSLNLHKDEFNELSRDYQQQQPANATLSKATTPSSAEKQLLISNHVGLFSNWGEGELSSSDLCVPALGGEL